ncbi:MAG: hypothetical protein A2Y14_01530 [Verrucomicrobia bacterium GWF2_51_19]|nr:MAG: hypothetical protein A2Y14_01530 [Verrucomicrobia bacterium GWF2_51_19]HCJ11648.1 hypothetical protein [Opitutae bacterium]
MRIIDKYILLQWLQSFLATVLVTAGILVMEDMYKELTTLMDYGATAGELWAYYGLLLPQFFGVVIPVSFLISLLYVLNRMHQAQEVVAMRAAGMSLWAMLRSLWIVGMVLTVFLFLFNASVIPLAMEKHRVIVDDLRFREGSKQDSGVLLHVTFDHPSEHRRWFFNRFNETTLHGYGVTVFQLDANGAEHDRYNAGEAYFDGDHWVLVDGRTLKFDANGEPVKSLGFDKKELPNVRETPQMMLLFRKKPKLLSFFELQTIKTHFDDDNPLVAPYVVRYYSVLLNPLLCLALVGLAIPFSIAGVRTNPMVGISKALGLFFLFYVLSSVCALLGEQTVLHPLVAACLPGTCIVLITIYFYQRP